MDAIHVKCKRDGEKRWSFLTSGAGTTYLRIHAARFESMVKAKALIDANKDDNPDFAWRIVDGNGKLLYGDIRGKAAQ